jgi:hypothetical protein
LPSGVSTRARIAPRHGVRRLAVRLDAARHVDVEQVHLVVTRRALSVGLVDQARGTHAAVGVLAQGHRAADDPYLEALRRIRKEVLDAPGAIRLGNRALVGALQTHEPEVFRQRGEHRAEPRRFLEVPAGRREIGLDLVARGHLDGGDTHAGMLMGTFLIS